MNQSSILHALMALAIVACIGVATNPALAEHARQTPEHAPSAAAMSADLLLARPLGLVSTVAGTGVFILSLPFTLISGSVDTAAEKLVADPAIYTFDRPLGEFE